MDVPMPKRRRISRSEEILAAVSASIQNEQNQSIPRRSQELGIAQTTLWRIMRKDKLFQYNNITSPIGL